MQLAVHMDRLCITGVNCVCDAVLWNVVISDLAVE